MSRKIPTRMAGVAAVLVAFAAGYASGSAAFASKINHGLVNALNSVGQNLLGSAVFGARVHPPNPILPAVQMDIAADSEIPVRVGVFFPPDPIAETPCRTVALLEVQPPPDDSRVRIHYDASVLDAVPSDGPLGAPSLARCAVPVGAGG